MAFDLRGHGMSQAPDGPENYTQAEPWADDIAAIIAQLGLRHPILVGWSLGGRHLRLCPSPCVLMGPGFLDHVPGATAEDFPSNIQAIRAFMRGCTSRPLPSEDYEVALCWNIVVQRGALVTRVINSDDVLAELTKPVLTTQGRSDTVILPATGDHILRTCRTSAASWYDDVGYMPFARKAIAQLRSGDHASAGAKCTGARDTARAS